MKNEILFLSITNFFTIFSKLSLQDVSKCHYLNMRYPNEEMSYIEHDFQQIRDMFYEDFQQRGLVPNGFPFQFTSHLGSRIERFLEEKHPKMVFIEFQELGEQEYKLLHHVNRYFEGPIAVMIREEEKTTNQVYKLLTSGVKEILTDYDSKVFTNAYRRHLEPQI